ncbi:MAG: TlpA family protein disulfide reductase [Chlorobi bacterium]|nr:TlpA family protein disulfide reductase [Chlorobiota bacterium]
MKNLTLLSFLVILLFSCKTHENENVAKIHGKVLSGNIQNVKFDWITSNALQDGSANKYIAKVDSEGFFSVEIPINNLSSGRILSGRYSHNIFFEPGDDFSIEIDADTIVYKGTGAEKNNFLYALEKEKLSDMDYYSISVRGKLTPEEFVNESESFKQKRLDFINSYLEQHKLNKEFVDYFKTKSVAIYENLIRSYPRKYSYFNKIPVDSLKLPDEYNRLNVISNIMDDKKVVTSIYLLNLRNLVYGKAHELMNTDSSLKWQSALETILFDSLSGKTREYVVAKWLNLSFGYDRYDTTIYNKFREIATDSIPIKAVEESLNKYNEKRSLIGKPLRPEFIQTAILDTSNTELTFGQMMEKYKGNVIYLDIWGLGCGPCRAAMPYSKKMKEKLKEYPVKFIYLTTDNTTRDGVWEMIYRATFSKEDQYSFKNGFNAKLLKYMGINYVPCYMIFDKEGNLMDFNADRPTRMVETTETPLEKTLKKLALKQE